MNETIFLCVAVILGLSNIAVFILLLKTRKLFKTSQALAAKQILMTRDGVMGMGRRILALEQQLDNLRETQQHKEVEQHEHAYSKARSLLAMGISDDAIAENSGLTASEVNLMKLIQAGISGVPEHESVAFSV